MERSVPKRRHIHFRRHGIIQKKEYKQNKVLMYFKSDYMLRVHILTADKVRYKQISLTSFQTFQILLKFYGKILLIFVFHCSFLLTLF